MDKECYDSTRSPSLFELSTESASLQHSPLSLNSEVEADLLDILRRGSWPELRSFSHSHSIDILDYRVAACRGGEDGNQKGLNILHLSAVYGNEEIIREILSLLPPHNNLINTQESEAKMTPLHFACKHGNAEVVKILLKHPGINDTLKNSQGLDATAMSIPHSKEIAAVIDEERKKFISEKCKELITLLTPTNRKGEDEERGEKAKVDKVAAILANDRFASLVDINEIDLDGCSLLGLAVKAECLEMVKCLLSFGANPFAKDSKDGKMVLDLKSSPEIRFLLKKIPMSPIQQQQQQQPLSSTAQPATDMSKMAGYLAKYVNIAHGYKKRYVVIEHGILSYYKCKEMYPINCKGSLDLRFCKLSHPSHDKKAFELRMSNVSKIMHFKAASEAEKATWMMFIQYWSVGGAVSDDGNAERCTIDHLKVQTLVNGTLVIDDHASEIKNANEAIARLEAIMLETEAASRRGGDGEQQREEKRECLDILKSFTIQCEQREEFWNKQLEAEKKTRLIVERRVAAAASKRKDDLLTLNDEFFDALDSDSCEEEDGRSLSSMSSGASSDAIQKNPKFRAKYLVEPQIPEVAVPKQDLEFVRHAMEGYSVMRRNRLPADSTQIPPVSIWSIVKNAIGKDITRIPIPINFSEPLSMLQRICEDVEYVDLLYLASINEDPLMRLQYVAAFALCPYASTDGRTTKPFNPIQGETFEYVSAEHGFQYLCEQVSHHPAISAMYCESARYTISSEARVTTNFWGKSLELHPEGHTHVYLKETGEHFSWTRAKTAIYNIIMGKMWIDHFGVMEICNHSSGDVCKLELKATGWRTSEPKKVIGSVKDAQGALKYRLEGFWNRHLNTTNTQTQDTIELWRRHPLPPWSPEMYRFSYFSMTLNELNDSLKSKLCPTDSRFRPDQRAMEEGQFENANTLKAKLEDKQRAKRKQRAKSHAAQWEPRWFNRGVHPVTGHHYWEYLGGYWESRKRGDWGASESLYLSEEEDATSSSNAEC